MDHCSSEPTRRPMRAVLVAATVALLWAPPAMAQLIRIKTLPLADGDQWRIFPSTSASLGDVSIALADSFLIGSAFKIVNQNLRAIGLEYLFDKLQVQGVNLIGVLGLFVREGDIQCNLVRLIHYRSFAGDHLANVKLEQTGNTLQVMVSAGNQFIRSLWLFGLGPEDDNV